MLEPKKQAEKDTLEENLMPIEKQAFISDAWNDEEIPFLDPRVLPEISTEKTEIFDVLRPEVLEKITNGLNERTIAKYCKYWKLYLSYCNEMIIPQKSEVSVCHFIHDMIDRKVFKVGSVWCVYSCLNWTYTMTFCENLNSYRQLRALLNSLKKYIYT